MSAALLIVGAPQGTPYLVTDALDLRLGRELASGRLLFHPPGVEPHRFSGTSDDVILAPEAFAYRVRLHQAGYLTDAADSIEARIALALAGGVVA